MQKKNIIRPLLITLLILAVPFLAGLFTDQVAWDLGDPDVWPAGHGPEVMDSRIVFDHLQQGVNLAEGIHAGPQNPDLAFINPLAK